MLTLSLHKAHASTYVNPIWLINIIFNRKYIIVWMDALTSRFRKLYSYYNLDNNLYTVIMIYVIKTHGSESQGQGEAASGL